MQIVPLTTALDWHLQLAAGSGCGSETHVPLAKLPVHAAPVSATRCMCGPFEFPRNSHVMSTRGFQINRQPSKFSGY